jgi:hypothetical protein
MKKLRNPQTLSEKYLQKQALSRGHRFYLNKFPSFWLQSDDPDLWEILLTVPVSKLLAPLQVHGSRFISGNGAIDGSLKPCYRERLDKVNEKRLKYGWEKISP